MDTKDKWSDVSDHLCPKCGEFMNPELWVCWACDEMEEWRDIPSYARTWAMMYGALFVCALCGGLFEDAEDEILESVERYCCPDCRLSNF